jgi:hypothetical protein
VEHSADREPLEKGKKVFPQEGRTLTSEDVIRNRSSISAVITTEVKIPSLPRKAEDSTRTDGSRPKPRSSASWHCGVHGSRLLGVDCGSRPFGLVAEGGQAT